MYGKPNIFLNPQEGLYIYSNYCCYLNGVYQKDNIFKKIITKTPEDVSKIYIAILVKNIKSKLRILGIIFFFWVSLLFKQQIRHFLS